MLSPLSLSVLLLAGVAQTALASSSTEDSRLVLRDDISYPPAFPLLARHDVDEDVDDCGCISGPLWVKKGNTKQYVSFDIPKACFCKEKIKYYLSTGNQYFGKAVSACGKENTKCAIEEWFKKSRSLKKCYYPRGRACQTFSSKGCDFDCNAGYEKKWSTSRHKNTCTPKPTHPTPTKPQKLNCPKNFVNKLNSKGTAYYCDCPAPKYKLKNTAKGKECVPCDDQHPQPSPVPHPAPVCRTNDVVKTDNKGKKYCHCPTPTFKVDRNGKCVHTSLTCGPSFVKKRNSKGTGYYCDCPAPFKVKEGKCVKETKKFRRFYLD